MTLNFFSRHRELIAVIKEWIDAFFAGENFGRRQSKGFGSFLTEKSATSFAMYEEALTKYVQTLEFSSPHLTIHYIKFPPKNFSSPNPVDGEIREVLDTIRDVHHVMKNGLNRPCNDRRLSEEEKKAKSVYIPSYLLKKYAKAKTELRSFDNEKRAMKVDTLLKIPGLRLPDDAPHLASSAEERRFFRAMLGMPSFYEFRSLKHPQRDHMMEEKKRTLTARIDINDAGEKVARFRSPITYKPVLIGEEWRCYLLPVPIPQEMFGRNFSFSLNRPNNPDATDVASLSGISWPEPFQIQTPFSHEFDLLDFLDCFTSEAQTFRESVNFSGNRITTKCTFGHLAIKKEERPDEQ